jgi:hypothetical protein|tara:strand:- start:643 stop:2229 length:1587 start_codon:yes stop_codon:yes gene_type:complete
MASNLSLGELKKRDNINVFLDKIKTGSPFEKIKGGNIKATEFSFTPQGKSSTLYKQSDIKNATKRKQISKVLSSTPRGAISIFGKTDNAKLGELKKSAEFGGKASGAASRTPSTEEQEKVTLKLFEILLKNNGYDPSGKSEDKLAKDFGKYVDKDLKKIWPGITGDTPQAREWYKHFFLQFKDIEKTTKLPNNVFNYYDYDEFMDFVTELVLKGPPGSTDRKWPKFGVISKKDSWNPADVWLVNKKGNAYKELIREIQKCKYISQVNMLLKEAYKGKKNGGIPVVAGVSLKKSSGKKLYYELVNLEYKGSKLPQVSYKKTTLDLPWNKDLVPDKVTSTMVIVEEGKKEKLAQMRIGSSGGPQINLEFLAPGQAAQLGKLPKNLAVKRIQSIPGLSNAELPTAQAAEESVPDSMSDKKSKEWKKKLDQIVAYSKSGQKAIIDIPNKKESIDPFINNITKAKQSEKWSGDYKTRVLMNIQIIDFMYLLTRIYKATGSRAKFEDVIEDFYYYAQKRGAVNDSAFGPFGKLY